MEMEIDLKAIQGELLSMMKDIHKLCAAEGVAYSLTGGSLLGAVREGGFIPWDDDMDIMVDRENYRRLCDAVKKCPDYEMGRGPWLPHIRPVSYSSEIEPYIDVFVLDHLPDSPMQARIKILLLRLLQGMLKEQVEYKGFSAGYKVCIFITNMLGKLFTRRFKLKVYDCISQIGNSKATQYVSITNDSFSLLKMKHRAELMDAFEECAFEDTSLMITKRSREYLALRYGADYMTPPPAAERIAGQHADRPHVKNERIGV